MNAKEVDFVDFGASIGGSIDFAQRVLGGKRPLGIDIDPEKVARMTAEGFDCIEADVTALDLPENSVRFVVMSHFLEHLPSLDHVRMAIQSAARVATEFLFIQGPYFDVDEEFAARGLKFYWSDWYGHTCHLTTFQLVEILESLSLSIHRVMFAGEVSGSDDVTIHALASQRNQHNFDPDLHPQKPEINFESSLYREMVCVVSLAGHPSWEELVEKVLVAKNAISAEILDAPRLPSSKFQDHTNSQDPIEALQSSRLEKITVLLLQQRRWRYLNYVHLRNAITASGDLESVLVVGADRGLGAIALAVEFPLIRFHLADHQGNADAFCKAREIVAEWRLENVLFQGGGVSQIENTRKFDLVALADILHRAEHPEILVRSVRDAA